MIESPKLSAIQGAVNGGDTFEIAALQQEILGKDEQLLAAKNDYTALAAFCSALKAGFHEVVESHNRELYHISALQAELSALKSSRYYIIYSGVTMVRRKFFSIAGRIRYGVAPPLFDESYYYFQNPDVREGGVDAWWHYRRYGSREGRAPNSYFDPHWYLDTYADVRESDIEPLTHYWQFGAAEGRDPHPGFSTLEYLRKYPDVAAGAVNPLHHYIKFGVAEGREPPRAGSVALTDNRLSIESKLVGSDEDRLKLGKSVLFSAVKYLERYKDLAVAGVDAIQHFLEHGARERRSPSSLFDVDYYLHKYPDVRDSSVNPLIHYEFWGEREGRKPNRYFDPNWYRAEYGDTASIGGSYLKHFEMNGGFNTNPSNQFDAKRYYRDHPDVMRAGINPLEHYLTSGLQEGRSIHPTAFYSSATTSNVFVCENRSFVSRRIALFVTHTSDGFLRSDIYCYLNALAENNIDIVLIIATDQVRTFVPGQIRALCTSVIVRKNSGFDFAAWAHAMFIHPEVLDVDLLLLLNDSIVGPTSGSDFSETLERISCATADVVGLTVNSQPRRHLQSYFLAVKRRALRTYAFNRFFGNVVNLDDKDDVIQFYELGFTARMEEAGLSCASLFQSEDGRDPSIFNWRGLLSAGVPFVKRSLLTGEHKSRGGPIALAELNERGFPIDLLSRKLHVDDSKSGTSVVHLRDAGCAFEEKISDACAESKRNSERKEPISQNVTFISPYSFANGLGSAARGYVASLMHTKLNWRVRAISKPFHAHSRKAPTWQINSPGGMDDAVIVHLNPDAWGGLLSTEDLRVINSAKRRIGLFVWELSQLPVSWFPVINQLDAVVTPTEYCAQIFRNQFNIPVYVAPHVVKLPERKRERNTRLPAQMQLAKFGVQVNSRIILYIFDGSSFLGRKNPYALVRSFNNSGLAERGWQLVLKTKHLSDDPRKAGELIECIGRNEAISLIDKPMTSTELNALFEIADIYASPHSSEGFGLTIAEAMAYGKVVVATDYGGSCDYLDESNGYPVAADIITLKESHGPYLAGGHWANVREANLTEALCQAAEEVQSTPIGVMTPRGERARARIEAQLSAKRVGYELEQIVTTVCGDAMHSDRTRGPL